MVFALFDQVMFAELKLPRDYFGDKDLCGKPLASISMVHLDIRERLAEYLLHIDPDDFSAYPEVTMDDVETGLGTTEKSRVYTHFGTGKLFERISLMVQSENGKDAIAICLILSIDETTLNSTRSRTGSPLTLFIANARGKSFRPVFLGYGPLVMPYPDDVLDEMLVKRGCLVKSHRDYVIASVKRGAILKYLEFVVKPLYEFECSGARVRVGSGVKQREYSAFFHVVGFQLDTKQAEQCLGTSHKSKFRKCRLCMELCTSCFCSANRPASKCSSLLMSCSCCLRDCLAPAVDCTTGPQSERAFDNFSWRNQEESSHERFAVTS